MSNKAITTNDLKAVLDVVLPPQPSEYRKLLWTNPNPTSAFSAQTISLDLSDYDDVEIEVVGSATSANTTTQTFKMKANVGGLLSVSANNIWWRYVTPKSTGVEFGGGYVTSTYGSGATANNNYIVPRKIYGIKYERVAPPLADIEVVPIVSGNTGTTLYRIGNIRALYFNGTSGSGISGITISSIDLPAVDIRGVGVRRDSSASGTQVGMVVLRASSGKIDAYKCSTYGSTISAIGSTDTMVGMLLWSV